MFGIALVGISVLWLCFRILALLFSFRPIRWVIKSIVFLLRLALIAVILFVLLMAVHG